ncbi:MAG: DUF4131 domain-containing protein [Desulfobacterales bacterium]|nr:DUF4131 domain-containing protein [Desulfobacterales bacterium]
MARAIHHGHNAAHGKSTTCDQAPPSHPSSFFIGGIVLGYATEMSLAVWVLGSLAAGLILSLLAFIARQHTRRLLPDRPSAFFALGIHGIGTILHDEPAADHIVHWAEKGKIVLDGVVSRKPEGLRGQDVTRFGGLAGRSGGGFPGASAASFCSPSGRTRVFSKYGDLHPDGVTPEAPSAASQIPGPSTTSATSGSRGSG